MAGEQTERQELAEGEPPPAQRWVEGADAAYTIDREPGDEGRLRLCFKGRLHLPDAASIARRMDELVSSCEQAVDFDLSGVDSADSGTLSLLVDRCCAQGEARLIGARGTVRGILDLYEVRPHAVCLLPPPRPTGTLNHLGMASLDVLRSVRDVLQVVGLWLSRAVDAVRRPSLVHWRDVPRLIERAGADGLPIVALINLLVGLIMAFQAAVQLHEYGADIFVADLVGVSVVRELGPLMTAIIVASRSGAAIAAELGTMKVSEEVDALRTLGLDPVGHLVFPRILALAVATPLLTLVADFIAVAGGFATALLTLDVTPQSYLSQTQEAISFSAVFSGLIKSLAFGVTVAFIACEKGLATRGGAEGVGRATTSAVVTILFMLVALDAVFTVLFQLLDF